MKILKTSDLPRIRKKLLKKQNGKCAICGEVPKRPCVDHQHVKKVKGTGRIRGVICSNCNVFLAKSENNAVRYGVKKEELSQRLRQIANYLDMKHTKYLHPSENEKPKKVTKSSYNKLLKIHKENLRKPSGGGRTPRMIPYPKSGKLTKQLGILFKFYKLIPEFYK